MASYLSLRISSSVGDRIKPHAKDLNWSPNAFAEQCVVALLEMIENPSRRVVPDMVLMLDAKRQPRAVLGEVRYRVAEEPPTEKKPPRKAG